MGRFAELVQCFDSEWLMTRVAPHMPNTPLRSPLHHSHGGRKVIPITTHRSQDFLHALDVISPLIVRPPVVLVGATRVQPSVSSRQGGVSAHVNGEAVFVREQLANGIDLERTELTAVSRHVNHQRFVVVRQRARSGVFDERVRYHHEQESPPVNERMTNTPFWSLNGSWQTPHPGVSSTALGMADRPPLFASNPRLVGLEFRLRRITLQVAMVGASVVGPQGAGGVESFSAASAR